MWLSGMIEDRTLDLDRFVVILAIGFIFRCTFQINQSAGSVADFADPKIELDGLPNWEL